MSHRHQRPGRRQSSSTARAAARCRCATCSSTGAPERRKDTFWALRDICFDIHKGEAVGLVGGNGSGKSTLLKMIAGVLLPDEGSVKVDGGVAPLIELTGGFRGELTCRDNLYVQAGLHGLSKDQIEERFEDMVEFAGPAGPRGARPPLPPPVLGHAGAARLRRHLLARRADLPRRRGARRRRQGVPREVLPAHGEPARAGSHAVPRVATPRATSSGSAPAGSTCARVRLVMDGPMADVLARYNDDLDAGT